MSIIMYFIEGDYTRNMEEEDQGRDDDSEPMSGSDVAGVADCRIKPVAVLHFALVLRSFTPLALNFCQGNIYQQMLHPSC
jgi:hypothetical protein